MHHNLEISSCDPLKYEMDIPYLFFPHSWENTSDLKGFNFYTLVPQVLTYSFKHMIS